MPTIITKPAGQPQPRIDKGCTETIKILLDLSELLDPKELAISVIKSNNTSIFPPGSVRTRKGKFLECTAGDTVSITAAYLDYNISILFSTSTGNTRSANFNLRVHR